MLPQTLYLHPLLAVVCLQTKEVVALKRSLPSDLIESLWLGDHYNERAMTGNKGTKIKLLA